MNHIDDRTESEQGPLRVAVVGNSNSVMRESFVRILESDPKIVVINRSIGSVPNVLLLDFLALEDDLDFDFIVVDTAVCDFIMAQTSSRTRALGIFDLFVLSVQSRSTAQIVLLTIPTRISLLKPDLYWQQSLYQEVAARFGLPILDGFELVRRLIGPQRMLLTKRLNIQAERLERAFKLPPHIGEVMAWRSLRDKNNPANVLGVFGFNDHLHFSGVLHALAGELLRQFILQAPRRTGGGPTKATAGQPLILAAEPVGGKLVTRKNSIIQRNLHLLAPGETAVYKCPPGYHAYGILSNTSITSCFLQLTSPAGTEIIDMHHALRPAVWIAIIVPIVADIGDGDIEVALLDEAQVIMKDGSVPISVTRAIPTMAELAELILVRTDWRTFLPAIPEGAPPAQHIESQPWAELIISQAVKHAERTFSSIEAQGRFIDQDCDRFITSLLTNHERSLSVGDRAKILLLQGKTTECFEFLSKACQSQQREPELQGMHAALRLTQEEDAEGRDELLQRARVLAAAGAIRDAEAIYENGMARFGADVQFWFEHAMLAFTKRDWPEATKRWQTMRSLFPNHASWFRGLVISLCEGGYVDEAEQVLDSLVASFPGNADVAADHALFAVNKGDTVEALRRLQGVRERFPDHRSNSIALIRFLANQGQHSEARQELSDLIERGGSGTDLLLLATDLADVDLKFDWLRTVWQQLTSGNSDRVQIAQVAQKLFERYAQTHDCRFLMA